jgi:hypothetical protein
MIDLDGLARTWVVASDQQRSDWTQMNPKPPDSQTAPAPAIPVQGEHSLRAHQNEPNGVNHRNPSGDNVVIVTPRETAASLVLERQLGHCTSLTS